MEGLLTKMKSVENRKNLEKGQKVTKKSTYLITKQLIDKGHSLEDIVIERDLTLGTVATHLIKIAAICIRKLISVILNLKPGF